MISHCTTNMELNNKIGGIIPKVEMNCNGCGGTGWEEYQKQNHSFRDMKLWKQGVNVGEGDAEDEEDDLGGKRVRTD